jgi:hypothetical protein
MATPHGLYVRYLVTTGIEDVETLNQRLQKDELPTVSKADFEEAWEFIEKALPPFAFKQLEDKKYDKEFVRWMGVIQVQEPWAARSEPNMGAAWKFITDLLQDKTVATAMTALLIKGMSNKDLVDTINAKFACGLKTSHAVLFAKYFANRTNMRRSDWKDYLPKLGGAARKIYFTALTETLDTLKNSLGFPAQVDVSLQLQDLLVKSYSKAKTFLESSDPDSNREARAWTSTVIALTGQYQKHKAGNSQDFAKNLQLEFDFVNHEFDSPDADTLKDLMPEEEKKPTP